MPAAEIRLATKAARDAILQKRYDDALEYVDEILDEQPDNYMAYVFKGKCNHMLSKLDIAVESYRKATQVRPSDATAWKGLIELYQEQRDGQGYLDALQGLLLALYGDGSNPQLIHEAKSAFNRAIGFVRELRKKDVEKQFLFLQLSQSRIYHVIEGHSISQYQVLARLTKIIETEEKDVVNKHIGRGKLRIDPKALPLEFVKYKMYSSSPLPAMWKDLLNLAHEDEVRRNVEAKLLKHRYELLCVSPSTEEKDALHDEVLTMAQDMVLLNSPEPLAWKIVLDWQDVDDFAQLDYKTVKSYSEMFPREGLAQTLGAFLKSELSPFQVESESPKPTAKGGKADGEKENEKDATQKEKEELENEGDISVEEDEMAPSQIISYMAEALEQDDTCVLIYRIIAAYYVHMQEYETAIDVIQKGQALIEQLTAQVYNSFENGAKHFHLLFGNSNIYYQAPKNFDAALRSFREVLEVEPENVEALLGQCVILREKGGLEDVRDMLQEVISKHPNNFRALFELGVCLAEIGSDDSTKEALDIFDKCLSMITEQDPLSLDRKAQIWWRKGEINVALLTKEQDKDGKVNQALLKEAYDCYVQSLHLNMNYASSYSSLGLLYYDWIGDRLRATKCFYRAFELDGGQIKAAKMLAQDFAEKSEWDLVEVLASRVVESDKVRTYFVKQSKDDQCWPYRALGIVALNKQDYAKAVQYLQQSLRIFPEDANSWMGLGEAYTHSGRYNAGSKAFDRALLFRPDDAIILYHKALVECEMQEFDVAIDILESLHSKTDSSDAFAGLFLHTLIQTCVLGARHSLNRDMYTLAVERANQALDFATSAIVSDSSEDSNKSSVWRNVAYATDILRHIQVNKDLEVRAIDELLANCNRMSEQELVDDTTIGAKLDILFLDSLHCALEEHENKADKAHGWFELGLGYYELYRSSGMTNKEHLQSSMDALKRSIELESRNYNVWDAYGVVSRNINVRVAQHAFIRSLSINPRNPRAFTNLAVLYISLGDVELASEAIDRALSIDAEYVGAWVCQAVCESMQGNSRSAEILFEHCNSISTGSDSIARLMYGMATYEKCIEFKEAPEESGILALRKYLALKPNDQLGLAVEAALLERSGDFELATHYIEKLGAEAERDYESKETTESLMKFVGAKSQLARLHLGAHRWAEAVAEAETVLSILDDDDEESGDRNSHYKFKLSACLTAGLGHYFMKNLGGAIESFQVALQMSEEDQDVVILLAQVLWANSTNDTADSQSEKEAALEQLFGSISQKGASTKIVLILGVLGLVSDPDLIEAAGEEIDNLSLDDLRNDVKDHNIQEISALIKQSPEPWQRAIALWPESYKAWKVVDPVMGLRLANMNSVRMSSMSISEALINANPTVESAQRALFLSPRNEKAWQLLASAV